MNYVGYSIVAAVLFACNGLISKYSSKHALRDPVALMIYFLLTNFILALALLPFVSLSVPPLDVLRALIGAGLTYLVGFYLFYQAIAKVDATSFAPIFQLQAVVVLVLAYLFLGERFLPINYFWSALVIFGAALVTLDESMSLKSFFKLEIGLLILMQFFHGTTGVLMAYAVKQLPMLEALVWEFLFMGGATGLILLIKRPELVYPVKKVWPIILAGVLNFIGAIFLLTAFVSNVTLSTVIALTQAPIIFVATWVMGRINPKLLERHSKKVYLVRGIGLLVSLFGAIRLTLI